MTPEVFAAHLLAALPPAGVAGLKLTGRPLAWAVAGAVATAAAVAGWPELTALLDDFDAGRFARVVLRTGLLAAAAIPWAAAVAGLLPPARRPRPTHLATVGAVVAAVAVPAVAADRAASRGLADAQRQFARGRLVAPDRTLAAVADLDPNRRLPFDGKPASIGRVRAEVNREVERLAAVLARPLSPAAGMTERYDRAGALLALGRPSEVEPLLRDQLAGSPRSRLRLAEALADLRDWPAVAEQCRAASEAVRPFAGREPRAAEVRRHALDGLADALAEQDDRAGVEAVLREGADTLPAFAGHFRLRLGEFYRTTGRPLAALAELREAVRLDPALAGRAAATERAIREQTPGCLVGR